MLHKTTMSEPSGLQEMPSPIGEASAQAEVGAEGIGSIFVFLKGDKVQRPIIGGGTGTYSFTCPEVGTLTEHCQLHRHRKRY